jgi:hypothetical protein
MAATPGQARLVPGSVLGQREQLVAPVAAAAVAGLPVPSGPDRANSALRGEICSEGVGFSSEFGPVRSLGDTSRASVARLLPRVNRPGGLLHYLPPVDTIDSAITGLSPRARSQQHW